MKSSTASKWILLVNIVSFSLFAPSCAIELLTPYWNITTIGLGSAKLHLIPLVNSVPMDDLIIVGYSTFVAEFPTRTTAESSWLKHDLTSGGSWRIETHDISPSPGGTYTSDIPLRKTDLIFQKSFDGATGNVYQLTVSVFNETTNLTRAGGLPVAVAPNGYKLTYSITNWSFSSGMRWVALDICTNGYTSSIPIVQVFYDLDSDDPFSFVATVADKWALTMYFERWTLFDGELDFVGEIIPSFSSSSDYFLRNERNVTIIYPISGISNFEYDPTTFISIFAGDLPSENPSIPPETATKAKKKYLWIIGVAIGVVVLAVIITVIIFIAVPSARAAIVPYTAKQY